MATVESIQVSLPKSYGQPGASDAMDALFTTAFQKQAVAGPVELFVDHVAGDAVADTKHHGGPDKAALCYSTTHYETWNEEYPALDFQYGAFGENLSITEWSEADVCIGDIYAVGDAQVQVAQPRIPCWKISRRWQTPGLTERVRDSGRTGWYVRVLRTGYVEAGLKVELVERPFPGLTVARANDILQGRLDDVPLRSALVNCTALASVWREVLAR